MGSMLRSFFRMQLLDPLKLRGMILYMPQFARVFWRLMSDDRVAFTTKMIPFLGLIMLLSPPALELDAIPFIGELDWLVIIYFALKLFVWLCPADAVRDHVGRVARGA
jgi:hypothetical protein